jgi:hypothetical protein
MMRSGMVRFLSNTAAPSLTPAKAGDDSPPVHGGVTLAFDQAHEWIQDEGMIGLFYCADSSCNEHAVCPGCLHCLDVALHAPAAGLVVYWCVLHCEPHKRRAAR